MTKRSTFEDRPDLLEQNCEIANVELNSLETSCKNAKEEYGKNQSKFLRLKNIAAVEERNGRENNNNPLVMYSKKYKI